MNTKSFHSFNYAERGKRIKVKNEKNRRSSNREHRASCDFESTPTVPLALDTNWAIAGYFSHDSQFTHIARNARRNFLEQRKEEEIYENYGAINTTTKKNSHSHTFQLFIVWGRS